MSTKRFRLTKTAKIMVFCLILTLLGSGVFVGIKTGLIKTKDKTNEEMATVVNKDSDKIESKNDTVNNVSSETNDTNVMDDTINISLDEWIGWKSIIDANKGLTTQPDSIYGKLGINVNINIINDATQSSNALIKGDLNAAGYTINRTAFLSNKFANANKEVIMPYITNYSNGGDGIIAKSSIMTVKDLVGAKIGVPEFSEAQTLVVWFVNNSDLAQ